MSSSTYPAAFLKCRLHVASINRAKVTRNGGQPRHSRLSILHLRNFLLNPPEHQPEDFPPKVSEDLSQPPLWSYTHTDDRRSDAEAILIIDARSIPSAITVELPHRAAVTGSQAIPEDHHRRPPATSFNL